MFWGGGSIFYNPLERHDYSKDYFTLVALEDGQFKFTVDECGGAVVENHYYSIDNGQTWSELPANTYTPIISAGNKVLWKSNMSTGVMAGIVSSTGMFDAQGNVMSLVYGDNFANQTSLEGYNFALNQLFSQSKVQCAENLILSATTLANYCYEQMFANCTNLTTAPALPATTLANSCYHAMFNGCTSLTTAPELPAKELANNCYDNMFNGCTRLATAPELPATTLADGCYLQMFSRCTNLNSITCLATDISADGCTDLWVDYVPSGGIFTKAANMSSWTEGTSGIPTGWTTVDKQ